MILDSKRRVMETLSAGKHHGKDSYRSMIVTWKKIDVNSDLLEG